MKFNFECMWQCRLLHNLGLTRDAGSVNDRVVKNIRFANTFSECVGKNEEEIEKEVLPIRREKYSSADPFLDHDIEISFSISKSRFLRFRIFLFLAFKVLIIQSSAMWLGIR